VRPNYKLYKSETILNNREAAKQECMVAYQYFQERYGDRNLTYRYDEYNIFNATSCSVFFYDLFLDIRNAVRDFVGDDRKLWIQSWMNVHYPNEVLDWHDHEATFHGYVSIDPKKSKTIFHNWEIVNEIGNIYVGYGKFEHKVELEDLFDGERITLAFDIHDAPNQTANISYFPLI